MCLSIFNLPFTNVISFSCENGTFKTYANRSKLYCEPKGRYQDFRSYNLHCSQAGTVSESIFFPVFRFIDRNSGI